MAKPKNQLKNRVASFRINQAIDAEIEKRIHNKILGCSTSNKFYRKLVIDWFYDKLAYKDPADFNIDPDVAAAMLAAAPARSPAPKG